MRQLDQLIKKNEKSLKQNKGVDERALRVCKRKCGFQYYLEDKEGKRTYVKVRDVEKVRKVAQREYDVSIHKTLLALRNRLERFLKLYDIESIEKEYEKLCEAKKMLVTPVVMTDEEYIKQWEHDNKGGMNPFPDVGQYLTNKGEYVRSKSEKILADLFYKHGIPYIYEPAFELANGSYVYPDFALLNVRERKTIYWEHFGLISDGEYAKRTLQKLSCYEESGMQIGVDLLFSMESESMPLNLRQIEKKIIMHV
ncbi:MAG: hypothetical protein K6G30_04465 [Acetatifactor sp.]|nr:hypothetical protein [Acetatifactor sp.]